MSLTATLADDPLVGRVLHPPAAWRGRVAFASAAGSLTFADLADGARQVAGWLRDEAGVAPGDRVAICLPKSLEAVLVAPGADPAADLMQLCHDRLPTFARPRRIVPLADFPLTSTGKIDRMALQRLVVA